METIKCGLLMIQSMVWVSMKHGGGEVIAWTFEVSLIFYPLRLQYSCIKCIENKLERRRLVLTSVTYVCVCSRVTMHQAVRGTGCTSSHSSLLDHSSCLTWSWVYYQGKSMFYLLVCLFYLIISKCYQW